MDTDCGMGCTLAGPGRGDCEHFIGLPGKSIPGQHDGKDDTVDVYGKPNGWCWSCWKSYKLEKLHKENHILLARVKELEVSLKKYDDELSGAASGATFDLLKRMKAQLHQRDTALNAARVALGFCGANNHKDNDRGRISCRGHECPTCTVIGRALSQIQAVKP